MDYELIKDLYGITTLTGYSDEEIAELTEGFDEVPAALRDFWNTCGNTRELFAGSNDPWINLEYCRRYTWMRTCRDYFFLLNENQGVYQAAIRRSNMGQADPPVYVTESAADGAYKEVGQAAPSVTEFLIGMLLYEAALGIFRYSSEDIEWYEPEELAWIEEHFTKYPYHVDNWYCKRIDLYTLTGDELLFIMQGDEPSGMYSARTQEAYDRIEKLMRTMRMKYWDQLAECLESEDFEKTENVLSQIEKEEIPIGYVDRIFRFMEEHPDTDYGEPGPIVHFLERQIPSLYEAMLLKSVTNKPTCHTLWMLNRVINSYGAADSESFMQALQEAAVRTDIPEDVRKEAARFLKFQGAELDRRVSKKQASGQVASGSAVPQASGQMASGDSAPQPAGIAAEINRLDKFKRSLLQKAIAEGRWDVAEDLIAQGIDVNNQDSYGSTALHELCGKTDNVELIEQVLKAGGNPNLRDLDDMSPLYMAVDRDCGECGEKYKIIELLLKYGADKDLLCANGTTPAERAEQTGDEVAAELLARYPSNPVEKNYPKDANELYAFAHGQFRKHSYVVAVEAILTLPQEEITSDMAGTLIASYNNMGRYDDALAACERLQHLYRNKMRVWYYFTAYAYVGKKDCEKADESIAAGIAECDRERAAGIISERFYKSEIADFRDFEKQVKAIRAAAVGGPNRFSRFLEDMDSEALENAPEQELARLESLFNGKYPRMLMDAFREHVPVREIEGEDIIFYGIDRITEENTEAVPGANLYKLGLYTFASTADGDSICFDSRDLAFPVYQCSHSLLETDEEISFYKGGEMKHLLFNDKTVRKVSGRVADSFEEFVEDLHNGEADLYSIEEMLAEV